MLAISLTLLSDNYSNRKKSVKPAAAEQVTYTEPCNSQNVSDFLNVFQLDNWDLSSLVSPGGRYTHIIQPVDR